MEILKLILPNDLRSKVHDRVRRLICLVAVCGRTKVLCVLSEERWFYVN